MAKIRFAVVGSGWRARFYARIAQALPEEFALTSVLVRSPQKAELFAREYGVKAAFSMEELMETQPDFAVVAVNKQGICRQVLDCTALGLPVLSETPPALDEPDLLQLWTARQGGAKIQVAEQYWQMPLYQARLDIIKAGLLGEPDVVMASDAHDYHGISLIRTFLGVGFQNAAFRGEAFSYDLTETGSREGLRTDGAVGSQQRARVSILFESGRRGFYDFSGAQYHSRIRSRHFCVQGPRGELCDDQLLYLSENHRPCRDALTVKRDDSGCVTGIFLGERTLYRPPFERPMPDDETAIALCMRGMKGYLEGGPEEYSLPEALQDAYLSALMWQATAQPGAVISSQAQPWVTK